MLLLQFFCYLQTAVIILATVICILPVGRFKITSSEKKYLLPYCIADSIAMILLNLSSYIPDIYIYNKLINCIFILVEMTLLTFYINDRMEKKNSFIIPAGIFLITILPSIYYFRNFYPIIFLATNVFIGIYIFKYIVWLLKIKPLKNLTKSSEFYVIQGMAVCYLGSIPYYISEITSQYTTEDLIYTVIQDLHYKIYPVLNIVMFLFFIKAFNSKFKEIKNQYIAANRNTSSLANDLTK